MVGLDNKTVVMVLNIGEYIHHSLVSSMCLYLFFSDGRQAAPWFRPAHQGKESPLFPLTATPSLSLPFHILSKLCFVFLEY